MPHIITEIECNNCDFTRTYIDQIVTNDDILDEFYHCSNEDCYKDMCENCSRYCQDCNSEYCEDCIEEHKCNKEIEE